MMHVWPAGAVLLKQEDVGPSTPQPVFYMVADQLQQVGEGRA
jgi:hypothetical protein